MLLQQNRYSEEDIYLGMGWNSDQALSSICKFKIYTQRCNNGIRSYPRSLFMILGQYSPQDVEVLYSP